MIRHSIVIGTGGVANFCATELRKRGCDVAFVESRADGVGTSEAICRRKGIPYECLGKGALTARLMSIDDETLLVSASNRYLFPDSVLAKKNLLVVNYHGALLPKYPGRNAEAWAIFNCESEGGITWHKVVRDVDAGEILIQKSVPITEKTTSLSLLRDYARSAQQGFSEIVDGLLTGEPPSSMQVGERREVLYSWMKPNDGVLDLAWNGRKISAFLRAFDYGPLQTLGKAVLRCGDERYSIDGYAIASLAVMDEVASRQESAAPAVDVGDGMVRFVKDGHVFTLQVSLQKVGLQV